eukprot:694808-Rhodomonas_salina.1
MRGQGSLPRCRVAWSRGVQIRSTSTSSTTTTSTTRYPYPGALLPLLPIAGTLLFQALWCTPRPTPGYYRVHRLWHSCSACTHDRNSRGVQQSLQ